MSKFLGIQFAPLLIPFERRIQTLVIFLFSMQLYAASTVALFFLLLLFTPFAPFVLLYYLWMYYDKQIFNKGGRASNCFRNSTYWKFFANYFPIKLHKTAELPTDRNYLMGYHPHGILPFGIFGAISSNAAGFDRKFPGIERTVLTLEANFWLPFHREYVLLNGLSSVNEKNIEYILSKPGKGNAAVIVIGGAEEVLNASPGRLELVLKKRKGFVRLALQHGASLVPILSFGDNELFIQVRYSNTVKAIQLILKRLTRFVVPIYSGRGIFQYTFGLLPFRKPINVVVGKPIDLPEIIEPSSEEIDKYHRLYINALYEIFNTYKDKYASDPQMQLIIK